MKVRPGEWGDVYALVCYIPGQLGEFLNKLRRELVPGCTANAHVTLLPPRILSVDAGTAADALERALSELRQFSLEIDDVEIFPGTDVVYLALRTGETRLQEIHGQLNSGVLAFQEFFEYHPHITLAQEVEGPESLRLADTARRRWQSFSGDRIFTVKKLVFVRTQDGENWVDLAEFELSA